MKKLKIPRVQISYVFGLDNLLYVSVVALSLSILFLLFSLVLGNFHVIFASCCVLFACQGVFLGLFRSVLNRFYRFSLFILSMQFVSITVSFEYIGYGLFLGEIESHAFPKILLFWIPVIILNILSSLFFIYQEMRQDDNFVQFNPQINRLNYLAYLGVAVVAPTLLIANFRVVFGLCFGLLIAAIFPSPLVSTFYSMIRYKKELKGTWRFPLVEPFDFSTLLQPAVRIILAGILYIAFAALTNQLDRNPILLFLTRIVGIVILCDLGFIGLRNLYWKYVKKERKNGK